MVTPLFSSDSTDFEKFCWSDINFQDGRKDLYILVITLRIKTGTQDCDP